MAIPSLLFRCLLIVIALAPLPLASQRPWAWSLLAVLVGGLLLAWAAHVFLVARRPAVTIADIWPVALPFTLVLGWSLLQTWSGLPGAWHHPLWKEAAAVLDSQVIAGGISLDPGATWTASLRLATYGGVFWLAVQLGRDRHLARQGLLTIAIVGVCYAAYGLTVYGAGNDHVLWLEKWAYKADLTATFVNRNAYGAYAGMGLICCLALFLRTLRHASNTRLSELAERVMAQALPLLAAAIVVGTALLLSHSRGALVSTVVGVIVLVAALGGGRVLSRRVTLVSGGLFAALAAVILIISDGATLERMLVLDAESGGRQALYGFALQAIGDAPWTGFGLGAFGAAFHLYRDAPLLDPVIYDHAHNVHLEFLMDLGIPGAALLYLVLGAIVVTCVRGLYRRRRDHVHPAVALAVAALFAAHGLIDFSAQIPANAVTLAYLLGIGYAQSWSTDRRRRVSAERSSTASGAARTEPVPRA